MYKPLGHRVLFMLLLQPLFVESEVPHVHSALGRSKHPCLRLSSYRNIYSLWRAVPLDPVTREDLWSLPVPVSSPFSTLILHKSRAYRKHLF